VRQAATLEQLEAIYASEFPRFVRTARAITGDLGGGEDAVHDAFVSLVRSRGGYRASGSLEAWVWRSVVTSSLKWRRANPRRLAGGLVVEEQASVREQGPDVERVRRLVAALPEQQRICLFLRHYADLDYATIASALGIAAGTVAATLNAAHRRLRATLEEALPA
jgi:RNA polymerase sigma factor (sigma-70 family)